MGIYLQRVVSARPGTIVVDVRDAKAPFLLRIEQTSDDAWSLQGAPGGPPLRVDRFVNGR